MTNKLIYCTTKELSIELFKILSKLKTTWKNNEIVTPENTMWETYKDSTAYIIRDNIVSCVSRSSCRYPSFLENYKVTDYIEKFKNCILQDVELGMIFKLRNKKSYLVCKLGNEIKLLGLDIDEVLEFDRYDENLKYPCSTFDVLYIYKPKNTYMIYNKETLLNCCSNFQKPYWRRHEKRILTKEKIADYIGIPIEDFEIE